MRAIKGITGIIPSGITEHIRKDATRAFAAVRGSPERECVEENSAQKGNFSAKESAVLLFSVVIVGFCTIIYELLIASTSSYFLGDSVKQFSIVIGLTMISLGLGTLLSRFIGKDLIYWFVLIEIILAIIGGLCVPILYWAYTVDVNYNFVMCALVIVIGVLIGLEIPLLTRIMETYYNLKDNISNVLSLDYLGAFFATVCFPFILLPLFGIFDTSIIAGILNLAIGVIVFWWFKDRIAGGKRKKLIFFSILVFVLLVGFFVFSNALKRAWENSVFEDRVIFSKQSKYQKIIMTRNRDDIRLFIDGNVQFSSIDEHRYHELLTIIPMSLAKHRENILVLGGGDGLVARELLKYDDVKSVTVVDLDEEITKLTQTNKLLRKLSKDSLLDPRVKVVNADAFKFLEEANEIYDIIISDLPDPNNTSLARLYSREFYKITRKKLAKTGIFATQATSPFFSPEAFWCIQESLRAGGYKYVLPYHGYVPSFGSWGFVMASNIPYSVDDIDITVETKFLDNDVAKKAFLIEKDLKREGIKPSGLDKPEILNYYLQGWRYWN
jgi:spermidine synthase